MSGKDKALTFTLLVKYRGGFNGWRDNFNPLWEMVSRGCSGSLWCRGPTQPAKTEKLSRGDKPKLGCTVEQDLGAGCGVPGKGTSWGNAWTNMGLRKNCTASLARWVQSRQSDGVERSLKACDWKWISPLSSAKWGALTCLANWCKSISSHLLGGLVGLCIW